MSESEGLLQGLTVVMSQYVNAYYLSLYVKDELCEEVTCLFVIHCMQIQCNKVMLKVLIIRRLPINQYNIEALLYLDYKFLSD